jgi:hypothetical protein
VRHLKQRPNFSNTLSQTESPRSFSKKVRRGTPVAFRLKPRNVNNGARGCFGDSQEWAQMVCGGGNIETKRTAAFATGLCVTPVIITPPEFNAIRLVAY